MLKPVFLKALLPSCFLALNAFAQNDSRPGQAEAAAICQQHYFPHNKEACFESIRGKRFDPKGVALCDSYFHVSDKQACLLKIANLSFSREVIEICSQHFHASDKQRCLLKLGEAMPSIDPGSGISKTEIIRRLENAVRALDQGETSSARRMIWQTIDLLEGRMLP